MSNAGVTAVAVAGITPSQYCNTCWYCERLWCVPFADLLVYQHDLLSVDLGGISVNHWRSHNFWPLIWVSNQLWIDSTLSSHMNKLCVSIITAALGSQPPFTIFYVFSSQVVLNGKRNELNEENEKWEGAHWWRKDWLYLISSWCCHGIIVAKKSILMLPV